MTSHKTPRLVKLSLRALATSGRARATLALCVLAALCTLPSRELVASIDSFVFRETDGDALPFRETEDGETDLDNDRDLHRSAPPVNPNPIDVHVRVFHDQNENGLRDETEPGLPGVRITNGDVIVTTDEQGEVDLVVDRALYRFAAMTIPAGWWPTSKWYLWVPIGTSGPNDANFGLRERPRDRDRSRPMDPRRRHAGANLGRSVALRPRPSGDQVSSRSIRS